MSILKIMEQLISGIWEWSILQNLTKEIQNNTKILIMMKITLKIILKNVDMRLLCTSALRNL